MDIKALTDGYIGRMNPRLLTWVYNRLKNIPPVKKMIQQEYDAIMRQVEDRIVRAAK